MPLNQKYLTSTEYLALTTSANPITNLDEFNRLERAAEDALDFLTNNFYRYHLLSSDVPVRVRLFKKAMTAQIDYYSFNGSSSSYQISSASSVQIGRTNITSGESQKNNAYKNYPDEVISLLSMGGFLFRGVATTCH